jgi:hypothetical protein
MSNVSIDDKWHPTGLALRRAGHHTYESVPGELKLVIKTDMSAYNKAGMTAKRLLATV